MPERAIVWKFRKGDLGLGCAVGGWQLQSSRKVPTPCICHTLVVLNMYATQPITLVTEADNGLGPVYQGVSSPRLTAWSPGPTVPEGSW